MEQHLSPELGSRDGEGVAFPLGQLDEFALRNVLRRYAVHPIIAQIWYERGTRDEQQGGRKAWGMRVVGWRMRTSDHLST